MFTHGHAHMNMLTRSRRRIPVRMRTHTHTHICTHEHACLALPMPGPGSGSNKQPQQAGDSGANTAAQREDAGTEPFDDIYDDNGDDSGDVSSSDEDDDDDDFFSDEESMETQRGPAGAFHAERLRGELTALVDDVAAAVDANNSDKAKRLLRCGLFASMCVFVCLCVCVFVREIQRSREVERGIMVLLAQNT